MDTGYRYLEVVKMETPQLEGSRPEAEELMWHWVRLGWRYRRIGSLPREDQDWYVDRIKYEMGLILERGLADFFLFTSDTIRWGKDNGVAFGPGRGSTAASAVAYLLRITEIPPHKYKGMIFERFLDITRPDPPDIDVDCSDEDRWLVWNYLEDKYGADHVGHIANFVRYRGKNSLADVTNVYNIPIWAREGVANLLIERSGGDSRFSSTLEDTFDLFAEARKIKEEFPDIEKACRLEGDVRGMSVHAAGLIIANSPLTDICAVYEKDGVKVMSIDKYDAEYAGALKLDFLGLSTMGMIARCLRMAGLTLDDLYAIPDDDPQTIDVFRRGDIIGVFQFEGRATRLVNRDVSPDHFLHIADINALSRPGPLFSGQTAEYTKVKHGQKKPDKLHPLVDAIAADTYGQIIYQEQILRILKEVGGFDWGHVGHIRRVISKKMGEAAFQMSYQQFADGAAQLHGIPEETADKIWKRLVTSGTYSFNIAHSISYGMLAFWTAWLKARYPFEFYAASLQKTTGSADLQFRLMRDALAHSIDVKPPSLEHSRATWRPVKNLGLVAGWQQIPKVGPAISQRIEAAGGGYGFDDWIELKQIPGIGDKTLARMEEWTLAKDPFGLYRTEKRLAAVMRFLRGKGRDVAPLPTHNGEELSVIHVEPGKPGSRWIPGPPVIYMGMVGKIEYKDIIEDKRSRTGMEIEEIMKTMKRPDLKRRVTIHCYDTTDEEVYARVNRWKFPELQKQIAMIRPNRDVLIVVGRRIAGFGTPVNATSLYILDPD
jgi:DNA polymerase-3 subunit alpha